MDADTKQWRDQGRNEAYDDLFHARRLLRDGIAKMTLLPHHSDTEIGIVDDLNDGLAMIQAAITNLAVLIDKEL